MELRWAESNQWQNSYKENGVEKEQNLWWLFEIKAIFNGEFWHTYYSKLSKWQRIQRIIGSLYIEIIRVYQWKWLNVTWIIVTWIDWCKIV